MNRAGPVVFKLVLLTVPLVSVFFIMPSAMSIGHQVAPPARMQLFSYKISSSALGESSFLEPSLNLIDGPHRTFLPS